mgnify:FL=1
MLMMQHLKSISPVALSLITLLFTSTSPLSIAAEPKTAELPTLITQIQTMPSYVELDARLEAINQSTISAQTSGIVEAVNVDINDRVEAGQILIRINDSQQQALLSQARANVAQAQALNEDAQILLKRNRSLFAKKTLSQGELDSAIARAKSSQAAVVATQAAAKQAQEQLSYTLIKAPYAGIVSQRMVQVGELVNPGQALMTGFSPQALRAITDIPMHLAKQLSKQLSKHLGTAKADNLFIINQGQRFAAESITLFPFADNRFSSVRARINLPKLDLPKMELAKIDSATINNSTLLPGSWVKVAIPSREREGIYVPLTAVLQQGEVAKLFIKDAKNQQFKLRYVRLGQKLKSADNTIDLVEVSSGLESNEEIALHAIEAAKLISSGL